MKALLYDKSLKLVDIKKPKIKKGNVLIKVLIKHF